MTSEHERSRHEKALAFAYATPSEKDKKNKKARDERKAKKKVLELSRKFIEKTSYQDRRTIARQVHTIISDQFGSENEFFRSFEASFGKNSRLFVDEERERYVGYINDILKFWNIEGAKVTAEKYFKMIESTHCSVEKREIFGQAKMILGQFCDIIQLRLEDIVFDKRYTSIANLVRNAEEKSWSAKARYEEAKADNKRGDAANKVLDGGPNLAIGAANNILNGISSISRFIERDDSSELKTRALAAFSPINAPDSTTPIVKNTNREEQSLGVNAMELLPKLNDHIEIASAHPNGSSAPKSIRKVKNTIREGQSLGVDVAGSPLPFRDHADTASAHPKGCSTPKSILKVKNTIREGQSPFMDHVDDASEHLNGYSTPKRNLKVNFDVVNEKTYYMEPGDANQVFTDGRFGFCKGGTPVKLGSELVGEKTYPCPEESHHGQPRSKFMLRKDQRMAVYANMSKETLVEHMYNMELELQTANAEIHHLKGKNYMLQTRIESSKDVFRKTDGKLAAELSEQLATEKVKNRDLQYNSDLMYQKLQSTCSENARLTKELQIQAGVQNISPSVGRRPRAGSHPPKRVETYSRSSKKRKYTA